MFTWALAYMAVNEVIFSTNFVFVISMFLDYITIVGIVCFVFWKEEG